MNVEIRNQINEIERKSFLHLLMIQNCLNCARIYRLYTVLSINRHPSHLFGIKLVELHFLPMLSPQTQDFGFGAVGHVDQFLVPPAVTDRPGNTPQNDTVITNLQ